MTKTNARVVLVVAVLLSLAASLGSFVQSEQTSTRVDHLTTIVRQTRVVVQPCATAQACRMLLDQLIVAAAPKERAALRSRLGIDSGAAQRLAAANRQALAHHHATRHTPAKRPPPFSLQPLTVPLLPAPRALGGVTPRNPPPNPGHGLPGRP